MLGDRGASRAFRYAEPGTASSIYCSDSPAAHRVSLCGRRLLAQRWTLNVNNGHRACVVGAPRAPPRPSPPGLLAPPCAPPTIQPTQTHVSMLIPASSGFRSAACTHGTPAPKRREARRNRSVPTPLVSSPVVPHLFPGRPSISTLPSDSKTNPRGHSDAGIRSEDHPRMTHAEAEEDPFNHRHRARHVRPSTQPPGVGVGVGVGVLVGLRARLGRAADADKSAAAGERAWARAEAEPEPEAALNC
ncbi:hypothetical protein POSPLADRAFT_1056615 [Postia placenta MAD-698-R-SB12]|uniref:Uncharacterized protein n=1 Tax=Postia placenta MAD-698-R-SB12 TaxID=670580 RepID=A0A1X6N0Q3_9APHY|nr:hypothetical protein POSPLADRAFT_1056615 [Postia placenta MAD-698-R-SB12]OSX62023.1 hypothetical protein POSPLADRAFT_1056615 [Postia placenta MAD-698-R-SB12]